MSESKKNYSMCFSVDFLWLCLDKEKAMANSNMGNSSIEINFYKLNLPILTRAQNQFV